jgi:large subunit ribosomal protein L29
MMDVAELRDLTVDDLEARAKELEDQLFRMRLQQSLGQLDAPLKLRFTRRDLARIKTVILFNGGTTAKKPFFGFSGERDIGNPTAASYRSGVNAAAKAAFIFFHMVPGTGNSDGHLTLMLQPERVVEPTAHWLKMMLNDDADSKLWFVGDSCKLCGHAAEYDFGQKGL